MYRVVFALATSATALSPVVAQEPAPRARPIAPSDTPKAKPVEETAPAVPRTELPSKEEKASTPEEDLFNYACMLYKREANDIGIAQFNKYLATYPKGKHVNAAITLKSECLLRTKRTNEALVSYVDVVKRFMARQFNDTKHTFETEVNISVPASESAYKLMQDVGQIVVNVGSDGTIVVQQQVLTEDQLFQKLSTVASVNLKQPIVIRGDKNSDYEHIFRVLDHCRKAGLYHVSFASSQAQTNKPASP